MQQWARRRTNQSWCFSDRLSKDAATALHHLARRGSNATLIDNVGVAMEIVGRAHVNEDGEGGPTAAQPRSGPLAYTWREPFSDFVIRQSGFKSRR
jgi:hypothetical protein